MSQPINNGGPAMHMPWNDQRSHEGISIRDYFAAAALQGLLADDGGGSSWENDAQAAYKAADAMLKAREVKP